MRFLPHALSPLLSCLLSLDSMDEVLDDPRCMENGERGQARPSHQAGPSERGLPTLAGPGRSSSTSPMDLTQLARVAVAMGCCSCSSWN